MQSEIQASEVYNKDTDIRSLNSFEGKQNTDIQPRKHSSKHEVYFLYNIAHIH